MSAVNKKELLIVIILLALMLLPFCNKAYHIDDTMVVYPARQILKEPLDPLGSYVNWLGVTRTFWDEGNPPLIFYYAALFIKGFGESEIVLHLAFLIFAITCGISMYFLGLRFTGRPLLSSLLLITTPAFLVMSTNIMLDVPLLALYMASVATFIYGIDRQNTMLKWVSGILIGMTMLTKYMGLTVIPLLLTYLLFNKKAVLKYLWIFVIPISMFAVWCIHNIIAHRSIHFVEAGSYINLSRDALLEKLIGTMSYIGGATVFSLLIAIILFVKRRDILTFTLTALGAVVLCQKLLKELGYNTVQEFFVILFVWIGLLFLIKCIGWIIGRFRQSISSSDTEEQKTEICDDVFLFLWLCGILFMNVIAEFAAVRFVLILTPPFVLLGIRIAGEGLKGESKSFRDKIIIIGIVLSFILSLLGAYADYEYANVYKIASEKFNRDYKWRENRVFFSAHWGFQYYMEKEGFKCLSPKVDNPEKGDILIIPVIASYDIPVDVSSKEQLEGYLGRSMKLIDMIEYNSWFPVRTMHKELHAGFYSHGWGFLPFVFSKAYLERFYIWEFV